MSKPEKKPTKSAQNKIIRSNIAAAKVQVIQRTVTDKELSLGDFERFFSFAAFL